MFKFKKTNGTEEIEHVPKYARIEETVQDEMTEPGERKSDNPEMFRRLLKTENPWPLAKPQAP